MAGRPECDDTATASVGAGVWHGQKRHHEAKNGDSGCQKGRLDGRTGSDLIGAKQYHMLTWNLSQFSYRFHWFCEWWLQSCSSIMLCCLFLVEQSLESASTARGWMTIFSPLAGESVNSTATTTRGEIAPPQALQSKSFITDVYLKITNPPPP